MTKHTHGRVAGQVRRARQQLLEDQDLCLTRLLPGRRVAEALQRYGVRFRHRLYTPLVTLWMFLYQVLSADQSCRAAVARLLAWLSLGDDSQPSAADGPYCKARQRLPEPLLADLARQSGAEVHQQAPAMNLLQGRPIKIADGTMVSMPDTPANRKAYPQPPSQKPGVGFPLLRLVALISLSCGAVLDVAIAPYSGKQTGETALFRQLFGGLRAGEVLLGDAIFGNYWTMVMLQQRQVDVLSRHDGKRRIDWCTGQRLGRRDHVVFWVKPARPKWMSRRLYRSLPKTLAVREVEVEVPQRGFRTRRLLLVTTLLDGQLYPREELAAAFRARWHGELDLRAIKSVMQMDVLRCKTPQMVRKELWMHVLAYNLVRQLMLEAATAAQVSPRDLSFKGTLQTLVAFAGVGGSGPPQRSDARYRAILRAVASHRVNNRPDRVEPRAVKRRAKPYDLLNEPRAVVKARLLQRS